jgi:hypothetical protein
MIRGAPSRKLAETSLRSPFGSLLSLRERRLVETERTKLPTPLAVVEPVSET